MHIPAHPLIHRITRQGATKMLVGFIPGEELEGAAIEVKHWSITGHILVNTGQILVTYWSNTGQILVETGQHWSNTGRTLVTYCQTLVTYLLRLVKHW